VRITAFSQSAFGLRYPRELRGMGQVKPSMTVDAVRSVETVAKEINAALDRRDRSAMEQRIADPFTLLNSGGAVDHRTVFLDRVATGRVRAAADNVAEFDIAIDTYGLAAVRQSRVRRRNTKQGQERWSLQTMVFVKTGDNWRLASWQGTGIYSGPIIDMTTKGTDSSFSGRPWQPQVKSFRSPPQISQMT
jgi:hypothetical protein